MSSTTASPDVAASTPSTVRPVVAVTMGDAAGIGPELCLRLLDDRHIVEQCVPVVFGDADVLYRVADVCGLNPPERVLAHSDWQSAAPPAAPVVVDCAALGGCHIERGMPQAACGAAAYQYVRRAVSAAMDARAAAIVTAPLCKESLHMAGIDYPGHTEMLASMTQSDTVRMMFACDELMVTLTTIHLPYADVPGRLSVKSVRQTIAMTADALLRLGRPEPRLVVCGLNPHAGEAGLFGDEETRIILPAIEDARSAGLDVTGPLPPDTAFLPSVRECTDAFIAMYHDQGLIPFKMVAFERGVNLTLGLPIVRTSPDHGTAFDIAWQGRARATSMFESVRWALRLA
jgi:4-hydroxythreonine-4-phosphate dehydrogenase